MKITETELSDLFKKVYEGMGLPYGDYLDCAQMLTWLAMHGIVSMDEMANLMPNWTLPASEAPNILFEDGTTAVLQSHPSLLYNGLALEFAAHKAQQIGHSIIKLKAVEFPFLIIPHISAIAKRGLYCAISLSGEEGGKTAVSIHPYQPYPHISSSLLTTAVSELTIKCSTQSPKLSPSQSLKLPQAYRRHNQSGLDISPETWQQLLALSKSVLVPDSDLSRSKGAGEGA